MRNSLSFVMFLLFLGSPVLAQVADDSDGLYDSTSFVATDSNTNSTSNVTSNNTNTNNTTIVGTNTNTNNTTVNSTATNTNTNVNTNTNTNNSTSNITQSVTNNSTSNSTVDQTVNSTTNSTVDQTVNSTTNSTIDQTVNTTTNSTIDQTVTSTVTSTNTNNNTNNNTNVNTNTNNSTVTSTSENVNTNVNDTNVNQKIETPPPSAIAPTIQMGGNDTCTVTFSAAVQTQILGMSGGGHVRDMNCERLKNSKTLYNMGMKVAAVSLMCQDPNVYKAMQMAGTPCPFNGEIGDEAQKLWDQNPSMQPSEIEKEVRRNDKLQGAAMGGLSVALLLLLL